jgi:hypothetical protein
MTQVLREDQDQRMNTGANRAATWKSSAPGGRDIADMVALTGNSANAELAAGQRSLAVSGIWMLLVVVHSLIFIIKVINRRRKFFIQHNAPRAIELADGLVGAQTAFQRQHGVLKSGMYAFVIVDNQLYVAQGMSYKDF